MNNWFEAAKAIQHYMGRSSVDKMINYVGFKQINIWQLPCISECISISFGENETINIIQMNERVYVIVPINMDISNISFATENRYQRNLL